MTASADGNGAAPASDPATGLRAEMVKAGVDAYIIPTEDPHMVNMFAVNNMAYDLRVCLPENCC